MLYKANIWYYLINTKSIIFYYYYIFINFEKKYFDMLRKLLFIKALLLLFAFMSSGQGSLQFNQVLLISSDDGLVTVPEDKVWKIVSVNGGNGTIFSDSPVSAHCGTTCTGGSCSYSSCLFEAFIWELNGSPTGRITGCKNCSGSTCYNNIEACGTHSWDVVELPQVNTPLWLAETNTLKVNMTDAYFSIIEFNIIP